MATRGRKGVRSHAAAAIAAGLLAMLATACAPGMMGEGMGRGMMWGGGARPVTTPAPTVTPGGPGTVSFRRDVEPILRDRCVVCHGGSAGLWLDGYETLMVGGDRGAVIAAGDPAGSELLRRVTGDSQPRMPLNLPPLDAAEIETIRAWIAEGAAKN